MLTDLEQHIQDGLRLRARIYQALDRLPPRLIEVAPAKAESLLVTQAEWIASLGVSVTTFTHWRTKGVKTMQGRINIPPPVDLPGRPRWKREDVNRITRLLINGKPKFFGRARTPDFQRRRPGEPY